jgi:hypothetical protein
MALQPTKKLLQDEVWQEQNPMTKMKCFETVGMLRKVQK